MPMKLKLQERTEVDPAFLAALKELWKQRWKGLNNEVKNADPRYREMVVSRNAHVMGLLRAYCTNSQAYDQQKTQLMCLPYIRFWTIEHKGAEYLVGLTKPILLTDGAQKRWQGPRYFVYIPKDYTERGTDGKFHFVPEGNEFTNDRHPHHRAYNDALRIEHPLDMTPSTCWGEFPTIVKGCVHAADTVNLFRTLHLYLSRVNERSLLVLSMRACAHFVPLPNAEAASLTASRRSYR